MSSDTNLIPAVAAAILVMAAAECGDSPGRFGSCCDGDDECSTGVCDVLTRTCSQTCNGDGD